MSSDWPFTWEGTASIPSPLRTVCGHTETRVALLTPGVGKLSCRIHWRGAATNRAMPYVLACAEKPRCLLQRDVVREGCSHRVRAEVGSLTYTRHCRNAIGHRQWPKGLEEACPSWFQVREKPSACPGGTAMNSICPGAKAAPLPTQGSLQTEHFWALGPDHSLPW